MDEPTLRKQLKQIAENMQELLHVDQNDAKAHGNLVGLANELDRVSNNLSDSNVKPAVYSVVYMIGGGLAGYTIGTLLDNLEHLVMLL